MKKLFAGLVIITLLLISYLVPSLVLASDITAAKFKAIITVSNNGTATTNVATVFTGNTTAWAASDYMNTSGNNTAILSSSGAFVVYMPGYDGNPWPLWVSSIGAFTHDTDILYMGGATDMASPIRYFPAAGGMTTTDSATLEPSNNFTIEQKGWVGTILGASKDLVSKLGAFKTFVSPTASENVTSVIYDDRAVVVTSNNATLHIGQFSQSGLTIGSWPFLIDGDTGTASFHVDAAGVGSYLNVDFGSGNATALYGWEFYVSGVVTAIWDVQFSDDNSNWTTVKSGYNCAGGAGWKTTTWLNNVNYHRYWRVYKTNAAAGGQNFTEMKLWRTTVWTYNPLASVSITGVASGEKTVTTSLTKNLVGNGSFENGSPPTSWAVEGLGGTFGRSSTHAYIGTYSANLTRNGANTDIYFGFDATPFIGKALYLGVQTYATVATRSQVSLVVLGDGLGTEYSAYHSGVAGWEWLTVLRVVGAGATTGYISCYVNNGDTTAWFDNVVLVVDGAGYTIPHYGNFSISDGTTTVGVWTDNTTSVPNNGNGWQFLLNDSMPYMEYQKITIAGVLQQDISWEYGATFLDASPGGIHPAYPTFRTASSDADVSAAITSFAPISTAIAPAYAVAEAPLFITANVTTTGNFTTGTVPGGGPPGFAIVDEAAASGGTPNYWLWGLLAMFGMILTGFFITYMERKYGAGGGSLTLRIIVTSAIFGLLIAWQKFDWWMLVMYLMIAIAIWMMSKQGEVGGSVSQHGLIGFLAQSWVGLTIINRILEGRFMTTNEQLWANYFSFTQEFKVFDIFSMPVLNFSFFTHGIPSLIKWDYSFFGGNAQMFQYLLYSITAVVSFIIFGLLIGLLYNAFRVR